MQNIHSGFGTVAGSATIGYGAVPSFHLAYSHPGGRWGVIPMSTFFWHCLNFVNLQRRLFSGLSHGDLAKTVFLSQDMNTWALLRTNILHPHDISVNVQSSWKMFFLRIIGSYLSRSLPSDRNIWLRSSRSLWLFTSQVRCCFLGIARYVITKIEKLSPLEDFWYSLNLAPQLEIESISFFILFRVPLFVLRVACKSASLCKLLIL